jgi:excisionase family DNA binding protein
MTESPDALAEWLMTVAEAKTFLSLSRSTLYELMDGGHLRYVKLGRARRLPRRAVRELAAANLRGGWCQEATS